MLCRFFFQQATCFQKIGSKGRVLRHVSADYERVKRVFAPEQMEVAVQAEKDRKRPRCSYDWMER